MINSRIVALVNLTISAQRYAISYLSVAALVFIAACTTSTQPIDDEYSGSDPAYCPFSIVEYFICVSFGACLGRREMILLGLVIM